MSSGGKEEFKSSTVGGVEGQIPGMFNLSTSFITKTLQCLSLPRLSQITLFGLTTPLPPKTHSTRTTAPLHSLSASNPALMSPCFHTCRSLYLKCPGWLIERGFVFFILTLYQWPCRSTAVGYFHIQHSGTCFTPISKNQKIKWNNICKEMAV